MMDRLRRPMQALAVTVFLICALSLAGLGRSQARPSNPSPAVPVQAQPCNTVCKTYMAWSHRIAAMFRPSRPQQRTAARHQPRMMAHHAPGTHRPGLNAFAQWPVQMAPDHGAPPPAMESAQDAALPRAAETTQAPETPQAGVAPSRPVDQIAGRFPAAVDYMTATRAGTDVAAAADRSVPALADAFPARQGTETVAAVAPRSDVRLVTALLLAFISLTALRLWRRVGGRRAPNREQARLLTQP